MTRPFTSHHDEIAPARPTGEVGGAEMSGAELLPCPFCGNIPYVSTHTFCGFVRCRCGLSVARDHTQSENKGADGTEKAIAAWNTRPPPALPAPWADWRLT